MGSEGDVIISRQQHSILQKHPAGCRTGQPHTPQNKGHRPRALCPAFNAQSPQSSLAASPVLSLTQNAHTRAWAWGPKKKQTNQRRKGKPANAIHVRIGACLLAMPAAKQLLLLLLFIDPEPRIHPSSSSFLPTLRYVQNIRDFLRPAAVPVPVPVPAYIHAAGSLCTCPS